MKTITKLLFVVLLIGVAQMLPTKVHASGTEGYTCNWSQYGQCYGELQSWMNECTLGCTDDSSGNGGSEQFCYSIETTTDTWSQDQNGNVTDTLNVSDTTTCWPTEDSGESCIANCVQEYHQQFNNCLEEYCTPN
jgi:hypothetical protein